MTRRKPLSDADMTSSSDDITERPSTEDHVIKSSRDISVADHHTPDPACEKETPVLKEKIDADPSVQKDDNGTPVRSIRISPRSMNSRVYAPLPFIKRDMPASATDHKSEPMTDVVTPVNDTVDMYTLYMEHTSVQLRRIYSPVPYSRHCFSYSPVNWQKPEETPTQKERHPEDQQKDIMMLEKKLLSEIPTSNDNSGSNYPVSPTKATSETFVTDDDVDTVAASKAAGMERTLEKKDPCGINTSPERNCPKENTQVENDIKQKENRRKEQLIKMKPSEKQQFAVDQDTTAKQSKKKSTKAKQSKPKKPSKVPISNTTTVKESRASKDSQEMLELKRVYEAHLKEKEEFEKMIETRENEINEQLREMDEVMESIHSEHAEIEKTTGAFADAIKAHSNYKDEASRIRVQHIEQEISSDILLEENADLKEEFRELYDKINEIKERRCLGLQGLKQDTKETECAVEHVKVKNEEAEAETQKKIEEFNSLRMLLMGNGITYVRKGTFAQGVDSDVSLPIASVSKSPPLNSQNIIRTGLEIDIADMGNVSPDIGTHRNDNITENGRLLKWVNEQQNFPSGENEKLSADGDTGERNDSVEVFDNEGSQQQGTTDVYVPKPFSVKLTDENIGEGDAPVCAVKGERTSTDCCGSEVPVRQMSAAEFVRLPVVRERKSRIPKPLVRPYGRAARDCEILKASEGSSLMMTQDENYKRDACISDDKRNVTSSFGYFHPEIERSDRTDVERYDYIKSCSVVSEQCREFKGNTIRRTDGKLSKRSVKKHENAPKNCKKTEIKSKIDTGLQNRPLNATVNKPGNTVHSVTKMDKSSSRNDTKTETANKKYSNISVITNVGCKPSGEKARKPDLPPLKNVSVAAKNADNVPRSSSSFGNKTPLPNIKPANLHKTKTLLTSVKSANQQKDLKRAPEKRAITRPVLPPIKSSKADPHKGPFANAETDNKATQISSKNHTPKARRASFSPTPPTNAPRSTRKPSYRTQKLQSSRQDDKARFSYERA
ncbi:uncharacterized protein LOC123523685 [Mercenaria mercenaria]|uniref:uncharacterized protein LOC123523685 n=1 Tax=Mercenaria mercenaria TaxID=6596 RepID=UPI00234F3377|nr:uncharacterized protein LOC123523685 [Mercenaria mercenaria]